MKPLFSLLVILGSCALLPAAAQDDVPQTIDLGSLPADLVEDIVVPVPGEVFAALDRCGAQPWGEALLEGESLDTVSPRSSRNETGLLLGLVVANGFLAVQAENQDAVRTTGEKVLLLSDALGVKEAVLQHCQVIIEAADRENWDGVRQELDRVELSVREALDVLEDEEVAQLISIGGWLGGTDALLFIQQENYSAEAAELLRQPDLVAALCKQVAGFEVERREEWIVAEVEASLGEIEPLMDTEVPSPDEVDTMREVTSPIVQNLLPRE